MAVVVLIVICMTVSVFGNPGTDRHIKWMRQHANLTDEQATALAQITRKFENESLSTRRQLRRIQTAERAGKLTEEQLSKRGELRDRLTALAKAAKAERNAVLTEEQRTKLAEHLEISEVLAGPFFTQIYTKVALGLSDEQTRALSIIEVKWSKTADPLTRQLKSILALEAEGGRLTEEQKAERAALIGKLKELAKLATAEAEAALTEKQRARLKPWSESEPTPGDVE